MPGGHEPSGGRGLLVDALNDLVVPDARIDRQALERPRVLQENPKVQVVVETLAERTVRHRNRVGRARTGSHIVAVASIALHEIAVYIAAVLIPSPAVLHSKLDGMRTRHVRNGRYDIKLVEPVVERPRIGVVIRSTRQIHLG